MRGTGGIAVHMLHRLLPFVLVACVEQPPPVDHTARRAAFHGELKKTLGTDWDAPAAQLLGSADTVAGQALYTKSCGNCHGVELDGRGPRSGGMEPSPQALVGPQAADLPPAAVLAIVRDGSPGTGMGPWRRAFSEEQIINVVAYILDRRKGDSSGPPP